MHQKRAATPGALFWTAFRLSAGPRAIDVKMAACHPDRTPMDGKKLEDLASRLSQALPPGLKGLRAELEDNFRAILRANLDRLELVSRDRFDAQAELLARAQAKLEALEARLAQLERPRP